VVIDEIKEILPQNVVLVTDDRAGVHRDIRPYKKFAHLLVCSPSQRVFFTEFRQTSPSRLFSCCVMIGCIHPICIRGRRR
jgi:hypothetical protein